VKLPLGRIAGLRVGDVLRLPLPVEAPVRLQVGGRALFSGTPTTRGSQIAVDVGGHGT
jgi:flagellar motor switch protein FliM